MSSNYENRANYQYSKNPHSYLATASWQPFDYRLVNQRIEDERRRKMIQLQEEERLKLIFVVRTLEPDRKNPNSKKQTRREFL